MLLIHWTIVVHKHYLFVNQTTLVTLYAFESLKIMWSIYIFDHESDYTGLLEPSMVCFCMQPAHNCFVMQCLFIALHAIFLSANSHSQLSSVAENTATGNVECWMFHIMKILILKINNRSQIMQWNLQDRNMPFKRLTLGSNCLRSYLSLFYQSFPVTSETVTVIWVAKCPLKKWNVGRFLSGSWD